MNTEFLALARDIEDAVATGARENVTPLSQATDQVDKAMRTDADLLDAAAQSDTFMVQMRAAAKAAREKTARYERIIARAEERLADQKKLLAGAVAFLRAAGDDTI